MLIVSTEFFGVFSPSGELEAVDGTEAIAAFSAENLSPDRTKPNRIVKRVVVCLPDDISEGTV